MLRFLTTITFSSSHFLTQVLATQDNSYRGDYNSTNAAEGAEDDGFRRFNKVFSMTVARLCIETDCGDYTSREVSVNLRKALRNYGCNCFPEPNDRYNHYAEHAASLGLPGYATNFNVEWHHGFNGHPIDKLDQLCALTFRRFNCLEMAVGDTLPLTANKGFDCFRGTTHSWSVTDDEEVICGGSWNPNYENNADKYRCEKAVCSIELEFANEAWKFFDPSQGGIHHSEFASVNEANYNLNEQGLCQRGSGQSVGDVDQQCCGEFPHRLSYNANVLCCEDGEVRQC